MQSIGNINLSGVRTLTKNLFIGTFLFETVGAILLAFRFCLMMGFWEGLFRACLKNSDMTKSEEFFRRTS